MLRYVKKISIFPLSLLLLSVWTLALSPTPSAKNAIPTEDPIVEKMLTPEIPKICHDSLSVMSPKIRPGDLLLIRGNTWIDKVIKRITGSPYSHVAGVVKPGEAVEILPFKKTGFQKLGAYSGRVDVFTCNNLTDAQRKKIVAHILDKVGTRYDYILVLWEASRYMLHWVWPYQAGNSSLCSTLWTDAYHQAGVDLCPKIIYPSPGDLGNSQILQKIESY